MTTTLSISTSAPRSIDADAVVIGVIKGPDGPLLAPGAADLDEALGGGLGGGLATTLAILGVTGQAEEVTRLPASAPITAPVIAAVGLGPAGGADAAAGGSFDPETLRRAAGAAVRTLIAASRTGASQAGANGDQDDLRIALALPVADRDAVEAVAVGALLGAYTFTRYRQQAGRRAAITVLIPADLAPAESVPGGSAPGESGRRRTASAAAPRPSPAPCRSPATWSTPPPQTWSPPPWPTRPSGWPPRPACRLRCWTRRRSRRTATAASWASARDR